MESTFSSSRFWAPSSLATSLWTLQYLQNQWMESTSSWSHRKTYSSSEMPSQTMWCRVEDPLLITESWLSETDVMTNWPPCSYVNISAYLVEWSSVGFTCIQCSQVFHWKCSTQARHAWLAPYGSRYIICLRLSVELVLNDLALHWPIIVRLTITEELTDNVDGTRVNVRYANKAGLFLLVFVTIVLMKHFTLAPSNNFFNEIKWVSSY